MQTWAFCSVYLVLELELELENLEVLASVIRRVTLCEDTASRSTGRDNECGTARTARFSSCRGLRDDPR